MRRFLSVFVLGCCLSGPVFGQDQQTLADIRQELNVLYVDIQNLRRELSTTGSPQVGIGGRDALERMDAIEQALQGLTSKTEQLEFRIEQIVKDGTNRIGDLEFRLVELEGGDVSQLGETSTLGGDVALAQPEPAPTPVPEAPAEGPALASQEQADFDRARAALEAGDYHNAAALFAQFNQTYPGGPMAPQAELMRGASLDAIGDTREAARAYLSAFSLDQNGSTASQALLSLGGALGQLGDQTEACVILAEVGVRFPGDTTNVQAAEARRAELGCS